MSLQIGEDVTLGWDGAKWFDGDLGYRTATVEAVGVDWVVLRKDGKSYAAAFPAGSDILKILKE